MLRHLHPASQMSVGARFEPLLVQSGRRLAGSLVIQEVVHGRCAWSMIRLTRLGVPMHRRRGQGREARGTTVVVGLATVAHGVTVHARVPGHELHLYQADGAEAFGFETIVEIGIQRVHDLPADRGVV